MTSLHKIAIVVRAWQDWPVPSRRLCIATALSIPVAILAMGTHFGLSKFVPETI